MFECDWHHIPLWLSNSNFCTYIESSEGYYSRPILLNWNEEQRPFVITTAAVMVRLIQTTEENWG